MSPLSGKRGLTARRAKRPSLAAKPLETHIQQGFLQALQFYEQRYPELSLIFAIPNSGGLKGGFRSNIGLVMRSKREGVKKGVPDLFLPVARDIWHGLFIEMKRPGEKAKPDQIAWHDLLVIEGYRVLIISDVEKGLEEVLAYMALPRPVLWGEKKITSPPSGESGPAARPAAGPGSWEENRTAADLLDDRI